MSRVGKPVPGLRAPAADPRAWYRRPAVWSAIGAGVAAIAAALGVTLPDWLVAGWRAAIAALGAG